MIKFKEFEAHLMEEVQNFLRGYLDNHKDMPEEYPLEYESMADWWEQFECTIEKHYD